MKSVSKIYTALSWVLYPFLYLLLKIRVKNKKEDSLRFKEKLGFYNTPKPAGKVFWVRVASMGELNSAIKLVKTLAEYGSVLLTSTTITSANAFLQKDFSKCKYKVIHIFTPLDSIICVSRFLRYFKPQTTIFVESEIWFNQIKEAKKYGKVFLVNARFSEKSFSRWTHFKKAFLFVFGQFDLIFTSTAELCHNLSSNLKNVKFVGNLKYDAEFANPREISVTKFAKTIAFGSIHASEIKVLIPQLKELLQHNLQIIILPRHLEKVGLICGYLMQENIKFTLRSKKEESVQGAIYIADTMGEVIDFYSFSDVVFIGGSLVPEIGGHNPIEACFVGKPVIIGEHYFNCKEVVEELFANDGIIISNTPAASIIELLENSAKYEKMIKSGSAMLAKYNNIVNEIVKEII